MVFCGHDACRFPAAGLLTTSSIARWRGSEAELAALRQSVVWGAPFGKASWQERTAKRLHLQSALRARGRPRKAHDEI